MNKKAFTLIELLTVIIILSVLATVIIISVTKYMSDADQASYDTLVKTIKSSTELYVADHASEYPDIETPGSTFTIALSALADDNYIPDTLIDERTGTTIPLTTTVTVTVISLSDISVTLNW